jgi:predicted metal-binding protein
MRTEQQLVKICKMCVVAELEIREEKQFLSISYITNILNLKRRTKVTHILGSDIVYIYALCKKNITVSVFSPGFLPTSNAP